jgi:hypothetical protein
MPVAPPRIPAARALRYLLLAWAGDGPTVHKLFVLCKYVFVSVPAFIHLCTLVVALALRCQIRRQNSVSD